MCIHLAAIGDDIISPGPLRKLPNFPETFLLPFGFFFRDECTVTLSKEEGGLAMKGSKDTYLSLLNLKAGDKVTLTYTGKVLSCDKADAEGGFNIEGVTAQWDPLDTDVTYTMRVDGNFNMQWKKSKTVITKIVVEKAAAVPAIDLPQVLSFPDYNDAEISSYTDEWTATMNGASWTFNGFNNNKNAWSLVKCGRKNNEQTATILTPALNAVVKDVVFTVNKATNIVKVTFDVINGSETVSSTDVTDKFVVGDVDFAVDGAAGYSYKLTIESSARVLQVPF